MMIHVAEASGISPDAMRDPSGLASTPQDLVRDDTVVPWKDLTILAARVGSHFGNSEDALHDFGRSYYRHLEHLPYTRLASNILTLRGALHLAQRYTTPHNYEALTCSCRWLSRMECIKTNSLKYPADPHSEVICHITFGILEHFPTLFGRDPMKSMEMEIGERDASYHFTLPPAIGARKFFSRAVDSITRSKKNWEILKVQESLLVRSRLDARRREGMLENAVASARSQERASFSRDLHDGLGQTLSGIAYRIAALRQTQPDDAALEELEGGIRSALAQARVIAHDTATHSDLSLVETLRLTTTSFAGLTSIPIDFKTHALPADTTALPRHDIDMILREALANAVRHSSAANISVTIATQGNNLELVIRDDGSGIPPGQPQGFGMKSILARALAGTGTVAWLDGNPGTLVCCTFPLPSP